MHPFCIWFALWKLWEQRPVCSLFHVSGFGSAEGFPELAVLSRSLRPRMSWSRDWNLQEHPIILDFNLTSGSFLTITLIWVFLLFLPESHHLGSWGWSGQGRGLGQAGGEGAGTGRAFWFVSSCLRVCKKGLLSCKVSAQVLPWMGKPVLGNYLATMWKIVKIFKGLVQKVSCLSGCLQQLPTPSRLRRCGAAFQLLDVVKYCLTCVHAAAWAFIHKCIGFYLTLTRKGGSWKYYLKLIH